MSQGKYRKEIKRYKTAILPFTQIITYESTLHMDWIKAHGCLMYLNDCTKCAHNTQENSKIVPLDEQKGLLI